MKPINHFVLLLEIRIIMTMAGGLWWGYGLVYQ